MQFATSTNSYSDLFNKLDTMTEELQNFEPPKTDPLKDINKEYAERWHNIKTAVNKSFDLKQQLIAKFGNSKTKFPAMSYVSGRTAVKYLDKDFNEILEDEYAELARNSQTAYCCKFNNMGRFVLTNALSEACEIALVKDNGSFKIDFQGITADLEGGVDETTLKSKTAEYFKKLFPIYEEEKIADINFLMDTVEAKMQPAKSVAKTVNSDLTEGLDRADLEPDITMI